MTDALPGPVRVFDAHFHVVDPRFPIVPNAGYRPPSFTVADYRARVRALGVHGGAVVSGSFQGTDTTYLRAALAALGPGFVGVAQLPADVPDAEVRALDAAGVRAVRFNLRRNGAPTLADLPRLAARVHAVAGWHVEVYVDGADLPDLAPRLAALPRVAIDHLGLRRAGHDALLRLAAGGAHVKASGFGRLDFDPAPFLRALDAAHPHALLFGTDLPSTRAPRPFHDDDLRLMRAALPPEALRRALWDNALMLYRPDR